MTQSPTDEQAAVVEATAKSSDSLMIKSYAGCGKTSTLQMVSHKVRGPALALAFNKSIALELAKRFGSGFEVKTMNALGFAAMRRALPNVGRWTVDGGKIGKLITAIAKAHKVKLSGDQWDSIRRLVSAAQAIGLSPNGASSLVADSPEAWAELADGLWIDEEDQDVVCELAYGVLIENDKQTLEGIISFDDQVYWPLVNAAKFPRYGVVMVDEAQDLSPLNHAMLSQVMRGDGRLIACGDPKQAIYGFRGAHTNSMGQIADLRSAWTSLPLTLTFRCPKVIVDRQQAHAPGFRAWHLNPLGQHIVLGADHEWTWADAQAALPNPNVSLALLCRNNAPLFSMAFKLLRLGIGVVMLGSDIGKGLKVLVKKLAPDGAPITTLLGALDEWEAKETEIAHLNGHDEKVSGIVDRAESLRAIAIGTGAGDSSQLISHIDRLFARETGQVTLSSIHKAKGLEWDAVLHLDPWRIPSKYAKRRVLEGDRSQLEQELNLKYVCETRSRHTLIEANLEDFR